MRDVPDRRRDAALPGVLRAVCRADRDRRGVRARAGPVARRRQRRADVLGDARARPRAGRPVARRPEAPAGPGGADRVQGLVPDGPAGLVGDDDGVVTAADERSAESFPASDPPGSNGNGSHASEPEPSARRRHRRPPGLRAGQLAGRVAPRGRYGDRARPRARGDRGHHELHQHVEPVGDDRRGAARQGRRGAGPRGQAVGEDVPGAGLEGRHGVLRPCGPDRVPGAARLPPRGLRLYDLHRQLGPALGRDLRGGQRRGSRGGVGAERQPQLRGSHQPRRADELPRLAAAVRRLRAGRDDGHRPARRAAGPGRRRARTST